MKKIKVFLLFILLLSLIGCGKKEIQEPNEMNQLQGRYIEESFDLSKDLNVPYNMVKLLDGEYMISNAYGNMVKSIEQGKEWEPL